MPFAAETIVEIFGFLSVLDLFQFLTRHRLFFLRPFAQMQIKNRGEMIAEGKKLLVEGHILTHTGTQYDENEYMWARNVLCVPGILECRGKAIAFYFEIEILKMEGLNGIVVGYGRDREGRALREKQSQMDGLFQRYMGTQNKLGDRDHTVGMDTLYCLRDERVETDLTAPHQLFQEGMVIGMGIAHYPFSIVDEIGLDCFATCNGKLIGSTMLFSHFADIKLFPTINLAVGGDSIRANFGEKDFVFEDFDAVIHPPPITTFPTFPTKSFL